MRNDSLGWKPKRRPRQKLECKEKIKWPGRLKTRKEQPRQKLGSNKNKMTAPAASKEMIAPTPSTKVTFFQIIWRKRASLNYDHKLPRNCLCCNRVKEVPLSACLWDVGGWDWAEIRLSVCGIASKARANMLLCPMHPFSRWDSPVLFLYK